MNDLHLKELLQQYLNTLMAPLVWNGTGQPRCFINLYAGKAYRSDRIVSNRAPSIINIEFSMHLRGTDLDTIDDSVLEYKDQLEGFLRICNNPRGLVYKNWDKMISIDGTSDTSGVRYEAKLSVFYEYVNTG